MKQVESRGQRAATGSLHCILHNLLIGGGNLEKKRCILNEIAVHATPILSKFDARHLSNLIYSFGLAGYSPEVEVGRKILDVVALEDIFSEIAVHATPILSKFDARSLSNLIYSCGITEYVPMVEGGCTIMDILALEAMSKLHQFNSQDLSNMLWSYAKLESSNSVLFKTAGDSIVDMNDLSEFWPQALSNIIWSFATAGKSHPKLFSKFGDHIVAMDDLSGFKPQGLSNIIWAYAAAGESHPQLYNKLANQIVGMKDLRQFLPQNFSNIIWSYATAGKSHPKLFSKFGEHIVGMMDLGQFKPQELSNLLWAYATAGQLHPLLFQKLAQVAIARCNEFNSQDIANLLWAYATVAIIDQHLFTSFAPAVKSVLGKCNSQALANIAWSYAVANVNDHLIFNIDFADALHSKADDFGLKDLSQLYQWQLWQDKLKSGINLPPALREKCHQAFDLQLPQPSNLQDDVMFELSSIGLLTKEEVLTPSGYRLDALVEVNGEKVGIEVDGPSHFINQEPTGSTLLKRRQFSTLDDIRIVSVPYWEWDRFGMDCAKKQDYLRSKLGLS
jgi:hypothetical protein